MSGEREIRDTADALSKRDLRHTEILPLYARLSNSEQNRVFQPHSGRRIVLATNVAETSLTVPGIKYVIDPGTARISRYSYRTKVQRLPIEPVSRASANQRKAAAAACRKGSVFVFIRKTISCRARSLPIRKFCGPTASVILQMTALGLGDIAAFPFVEAPDKRNIQDGAAAGRAGAITTDEQATAYKLTPLGRQLSQLPVDPRLARMVLEAQNTAACARR